MPKIYCIGILAKTIFTQITDYHNIAILRNAKNETIDDQLTFLTVELDKFDKQENNIENDLDKLIYTMKNLHTVTEASQFPKFWSEEWLKKAISEVDLRNMTPEQKLAYEMTLSANALAIKNENKKIKEAREAEKLATKTGIIERQLKRGKLSIDEIAEDNDVPVEFVLSIQQKLSADK